MKIHLILLFLTPFLWSDCLLVLSKYPKISLSSRATNSWIRIFQSPPKAIKYGLSYSDSNQRKDIELILKCLVSIKREDEPNYTLGAKKGDILW